MPTLASIRQTVQNLADSEIRSVCVCLVEEVANRIEANRQGYWTFQTLSRWTNRDPSDAALLSGVALLVSRSDVRLLDMHYLFFDPTDEEDIGSPIEDSEVAEAYRTGFLIDPTTGQEVRDFESSLAPFFVPSPELTGP